MEGELGLGVDNMNFKDNNNELCMRGKDDEPTLERRRRRKHLING